MKKSFNKKLAILPALTIIGLSAGFSSNAFAAAAETATTTVNVNVGSALSLTGGSSSVAINLSPTTLSGTAQESAMVVVTNNATGYNLKAAMQGSTTSLMSGTNAITAGNGTGTAVANLSNGTWSFYGGDLASWTTMTGTAASATGPNAGTTPVTVKTTSAPTTGDNTTMTYGAKIAATQASGTYTGVVQYTATTNP